MSACRFRRAVLMGLAAMMLVGCSGSSGDDAGPAPPPTTRTPPASAVAPMTSPTVTVEPGVETLDFGAFLEEAYETLLVRDPELITSLGIADRFDLRNDTLSDYSAAFIAETQGLEQRLLDALRVFDRAALDPEEQNSYDVFEWYLDQQVRGHRFVDHAWPVHPFVTSYNANLLLLFEEQHPLTSIEDAEDYVRRLGQIDRQVGQVIEGLRRSEVRGILPPRQIVDMTLAVLADDVGNAATADQVRPEEVVLFTSFFDRIDDVPGLAATDRDRLLSEAGDAIGESFAPAWMRLRDYLGSIREQAPEEIGLWRLPDGDAFYAHLIRHHTSTDLTAQQIHELGLAQVERVHAEMRMAFDAIGYPSDRSMVELRQRAYDDAGFLTGVTGAGEAEIVELHLRLIADAEAATRPFFGHWPNAPLSVVPDAGGGGFYVPGSFDGSRPGLFYAGAGRRVWRLTLPTINYHEAVPGHHLQIAIAQELDLPTFRRVIHYNGYAEGWALYAERLAAELGLYDDDPLGEIGRLEFELLRAVRLVVDTAIHALGWSEADARSYMDAVIPTMSFEVIRYIVLPGQATSYMVGQQEILRLRSEAQARLGDDFDLVAFHDAILGAGSVPLQLLEQIVEAELTASGGS